MILINSSPKNALKIFQPFLPICVPVGIGCLSAYLAKEGIESYLIDEQVEDNALSLAENYAKKLQRPYIFGFSVLTAGLKSAITLSKTLKEKYPDSVIIFGGVHPTAMPDEIMQYPHIDLVLRGEAEKTLTELYRCIKSGRDYALIDNLTYRRNGSVVHNKRAYSRDDIGAYPHFPYHLFKSKQYDLGFVISSRGCPYECIFCSNVLAAGRGYKFRPASAIVDELELLCNKYSKRHALFVDDNFLVSKDRIYSLIDEIKIRGLHKKMTFNFQARADACDERIMRDLYDAGFRSVFFGLETASQDIMKVIKKNETVEDCKKAVQLAKKIGFHVSATFIYALPTETHKDRMDALRMSRELCLDMVRFNNATPYPGTELYDIAKSEGRLNVKGLYENFISVSTFIENPFNKIPFSYVPKGNNEAQIRNDILYSYLKFYLNGQRLRSIFTRPDKGVGWFSAGERFGEFVKKAPAFFVLGVMLFFKFNELILGMIFRKKQNA